MSGSSTPPMLYGAGTSERILGGALGSDRSNVVVATKGGYVFRDRSTLVRVARRIVAPALGRAERFNPHGAPGASVDNQNGVRGARLHTYVSARRGRRQSATLRMDDIDVYQLHGPSSLCPDETLELMAELVRAGKIRELASGSNAWTTWVCG